MLKDNSIVDNTLREEIRGIRFDLFTEYIQSSLLWCPFRITKLRKMLSYPHNRNITFPVYYFPIFLYFWFISSFFFSRVSFHIDFRQPIQYSPNSTFDYRGYENRKKEHFCETPRLNTDTNIVKQWRRKFRHIRPAQEYATGAFHW